MTSKPVRCTMKWCQHRFGSEKDMKNHKRSDPEHFYCKKCDVDCEDWEDLTRHKVDRMAPFVEGNARLRDGEMPAHIVCEFCGEDFKSFGGRKRHRAQMHPGEQEIRCPGCTNTFCRACDMVGHLEEGHCNIISRRDFFLSMQQKFINSQILKDPGTFMESLGSTRLLPVEPGKITENQEIYPDPVKEESIGEAENFDEDGGGVILDQPNSETGGYTPLLPEANTMPLTRENLETWPRLPHNAHFRRSTSNTSQLGDSLRSLSISNSGGNKNFTFPTDGETASQSTAAFSNSVQSPTWDGNSAEALFPPDKSAANAGDWNAVQRAHAQVSDENNLFKVHWWDPNSSDYKTELFFDHLHRRYCCPFPDCSNDNQKFPAPSDLEDHILTTHLRRIFSCPVCFKRFGSCAALIGHAEATGKCSVRESAGFKNLIEEISGGYLKAKYVGEKKIYRPEAAMVKKGQPMGGVLSTLYIGKMPNE